MSLPFEWRINHVFPLSITEVIDNKLSLLFSGTHGTTDKATQYAQLTKHLLRPVVKSIKNHQGFLADQLHSAIDDLSLFDETLIRIAVTRAEVRRCPIQSLAIILSRLFTYSQFLCNCAKLDLNYLLSTCRISPSRNKAPISISHA